MSATNRGRERRDADFYPTDSRETKKLYDWLINQGIMGQDTTVLDPCAGEGAILSALYDLGHQGDRRALEIREECRPILQGLLDNGVLHHYDIGNGLEKQYPPSKTQTCVITNPPFMLAQEFVSVWYNSADFVAMLLPLSFFGGKKRTEWWQSHKPTHLLILPERPSFVAVCKDCKLIHPKGTRLCNGCGGKVRDGTDAMTYAWFVWIRKEPSNPFLSWV